MTRIAVMGLGEAGSLYARGLADAGAHVTGYDPYVDVAARGIPQVPRLEECLDGAELVISLVGAVASVDAARDAVARMAPGALLADLNTSAPETKERVAAIARDSGMGIADVAVLAPVPRAALGTPLLACGDDAERFAASMRPFGAPVDIARGGVGAAARLKLLRSVFMKGMAALVIEGLEAARSAGAEDWLRAQIAAELGPSGYAMVEHMVTGTYTHAERRAHEMRDALEMLEHAGSHADMTRATRDWLERIASQPADARR
jgi:3-hydroxyisobutyrate dehydrogenase-like beta-hydroxyacid dehydrogenase